MTIPPKWDGGGGLDIELVHAQGLALAIIGLLLERPKPIERGEFGRLLGLLAVVTGETSKAQGEILALWAALALDAGS